MFRSCYLSIVQMGDAGSAGAANKKEKAMSFRVNRMLDMLVAYAVVGLTLTVAGATAVLGA